MLLQLLPVSLLALVSASSLPQPNPQYLFANAPDEDASSHFPSIRESTVMARRILHLSSIGTLVTTFPTHSSSHNEGDDDELASFENRPIEVGGSPIGLMEYYADCEPETGNPTLLAINIATPFKNYAEGSNISLSVRWWPIETNHYFAKEDPDIPTPHTPAALPRFSLHGHLEPISPIDLLQHVVPACFMKAHPDSLLWQPGNDIHTSRYMRLVVEEVYWFGGFGDRARIGWLPIEEWRNVTKEEIEECRLPGEKKKKAKGRWWHELL